MRVLKDNLQVKVESFYLSCEPTVCSEVLGSDEPLLAAEQLEFYHCPKGQQN